MRVYRTKTDLKIDLLTLRVVRKGLEEKKSPKLALKGRPKKYSVPKTICQKICTCVVALHLLEDIFRGLWTTAP